MSALRVFAASAPVLAARLGIAGQVALFIGVFTHVEQLLVSVGLAADVRPVAVGQGTQRPRFFGQAVSVGIDREARQHLRQRRLAGPSDRRGCRDWPQ